MSWPLALKRTALRPFSIRDDWFPDTRHFSPFGPASFSHEESESILNAGKVLSANWSGAAAWIFRIVFREPLI